MLAHSKLTDHSNEAGRAESLSAPGLWKHKWRPVSFALAADNFGAERVGKEHAQHLMSALNNHCEITEDWSGKKFLGMDLDWNHSKGTARLSASNCIDNVLQRFQH